MKGKGSMNRDEGDNKKDFFICSLIFIPFIRFYPC